MQPDALLFDMDGLLLDSERVILDSLFDLHRKYDIPTNNTDAFFASLVGTTGPENRKRVTAYFLEKGYDANRLEREWEDDVRARMSAHIPLRPDVETAIPALKRAGYRMAVVTSTRSEKARAHLAQVGLLDNFELLIGGDEVPANKPDPAPYVMAAERLAVSPKRCVAFEDSDTGMTAAVRAGCTTVQIPDIRPVDLPLPNMGQMVFSSLGEALHSLKILQPVK